MDEAWHRILRIEDLEALSPISLCGPKGAASQCSRSDCLCYHWYSLKQTHATCSCRMNYIFPKLVYWCLSLNLVHLRVFTKYLPFWKLLGKTRYLKAAHPFGCFCVTWQCSLTADKSLQGFCSMPETDRPVWRTQRNTGDAPLTLCRLSSWLLNVNLQALNALQTQLWNKFLGYKFLVWSLQILNFLLLFLGGFCVFLKKTLAYKAHLPNFFRLDLSILDSCMTNKEPGGGREPQKAQHRSSQVSPVLSLLTWHHRFPCSGYFNMPIYFQPLKLVQQGEAQLSTS